MKTSKLNTPAALPRGRKTKIGDRLLQILGRSAPLPLREAAKRFQKVKVKKEV
jgi:hypothetical protein